MPRKTSDQRSKVSKPVTLLVYGLDDKNKPRAATFVSSDPGQIAKAAAAQDLKVCKATSKALKDIASALPEGQVQSKGQLDVPNVEFSRYRRLFDLLAEMDQSASEPRTENETVSAGLPDTWDEIAVGHLVLAQELLDYGWWEAIVVERQGKTLKLRYRDYPRLPKFRRPAAAVALLSPMAAPPIATASDPTPAP